MKSNTETDGLSKMIEQENERGPTSGENGNAEKKKNTTSAIHTIRIYNLTE